MKYFIFLLPALFFLNACHFVTGSGNIITEKRSTGNFTGISAGGDFDVEYMNGPVTEVIVEADDNIMPFIETRVSGDILKIRTKNLHSYSNVHMKIIITAPVITDVKVSASASFTAKNEMKCNGMMGFQASSGASITTNITAPEVKVVVSSGATINLAGKTRTYHAECSSGANLRARELLSENTTVAASSGADAWVYASVLLVARASSGATIKYRGAANVDKTASSGGTVAKAE